jgi:chromosomal replication initiator protein
MSQDVTRGDTEIDSAAAAALAENVAAALAARVGRQRFDLWLCRGVKLTVAGAAVHVAVAEQFRLEYLRRTFHASLLAAAREVVGEGTSVAYSLDPSLAESPPQLDEAASTVDSIESSASSATSGALPLRSAVPTSSDGQAADEPRPPRRMFASLDEFHVGSANQVAFSAARGVLTRPGQYSPLTFVGPPGCGKTHLLEGIWRQARTSKQLRRVIYLTAEQFTNQFLEALRHSGTPSFRRKYRDVELLLIDDVQFFAGKQSTVVELVHTVDTLVREGRQVVFAADRPPVEMRGIGQELIARLSGGLVCSVEPADAPTRLKIVASLAERQAMTIPADVQAFVAAHLDGDGRRLAGAINRLAATSAALGKCVDLELAESALGDLIQAAARPVRLPEIVAAVCDVFGVEADQLQSPSKAASVVLPRMLVMFLARKYTRAALSEIGQSVGRRSHSTVVSAQNKVNGWLANGRRVPIGHGECSLEEALRRVESRLKSG